MALWRAVHLSKTKPLGYTALRGFVGFAQSSYRVSWSDQWYAIYMDHRGATDVSLERSIVLTDKSLVILMPVRAKTLGTSTANPQHSFLY